MAGTPDRAEKVPVATCLWLGTVGCHPCLHSSWRRFLVLSPCQDAARVTARHQAISLSLCQTSMKPQSSSDLWGSWILSSCFVCQAARGLWQHPSELGQGQHNCLSKGHFSRAPGAAGQEGLHRSSCIHPVQEQSPVVQVPRSSALA